MAFVAGFVFEALGFGAQTWTTTELTAVITDLTTVSTSVRSLLLGAQGGGALLPAVQDTLGLLADSTTLIGPAMLKRLAPLLAKASAQQSAELAAGQLAAARYILLRGAIRVFIAVGVVGLVADLAAVYKDTTTGQRGSQVGATVFQPNVNVSPQKGPYIPGDNFGVSATLANSAGLTKVYHWKIAGSANLTMQDTSGAHTGFEFDSNDSSVTVATTPSTAGDLIVTCEIFVITNGNRVSQGLGTSTYKEGNSGTNIITGKNTITVLDSKGNVIVSEDVFYGYVVVPKDLTQTKLPTANYFVSLNGVLKGGGNVPIPFPVGPPLTMAHYGLPNKVPGDGKPILTTVANVFVNDPSDQTFTLSDVGQPVDLGDQVAWVCVVGFKTSAKVSAFIAAATVQLTLSY